jgi:hypothetical protein
VTTAKPDHDALYHRFFSDPSIVAAGWQAAADSADRSV